jgi:hypothetical protein
MTRDSLATLPMPPRSAFAHGDGTFGDQVPWLINSGDLDADGLINLRDLSLLVGRWGTSVALSDGELTKDTKVTITDLAVLLKHWSVSP